VKIALWFNWATEGRDEKKIPFRKASERDMRTDKKKEDACIVKALHLFSTWLILAKDHSINQKFK